MKKKSKITLVILLLSLLIFFSFLNSHIGQDNSTIKRISKIMPEDFKDFLRNTVFIFNKKQQLENRINILNEKIDDLEFENNKLYEKIYNVAYDIGFVPLKFSKNEFFKINKQDYVLGKFKTSYLNTSKFSGSTANSYIENYDGNLILTSAHGIIAQGNISKFKNDEIKLATIKSNIKDLIEYDDFYLPSQFGIKDTLVVEDQLFISLVNQKTPRCFNTSIIVADINFDQLNFQFFYEPNECIKEINDFPHELGAHNSGGRMVRVEKDKILMSVGDFEYMTKAQDSNSVFGKILLIDLKNGETKIVASGVRNPQGLYYSKENNIIYFTDHGPQGGDEINFMNYSPKDIKNFGWPISSYGEHYGGKNASFNIELYKKAPLKKSHNDFGFIEPIKYYTPSIAISQLLKINKNFVNLNSKETLLITALGQDIDEGDMSLHVIELNDNLIVNQTQLILNERIRDMFYENKTNQIFLYLESTGSIGVLSKI